MKMLFSILLFPEIVITFKDPRKCLMRESTVYFTDPTKSLFTPSS
jgi:hypothetical protein